MSFTAWFLTYQDAQQAARAAYDRAAALQAEVVTLLESAMWRIDGTLPDSETLVLLQLADSEVYPGYHDGNLWRYADAMPVSTHEVVGWRHMPAPHPMTNVPR